MSKDELIAYLRENLRIEIETESSYTGGMDGGPMYQNYTVIRLVLEGETISEVTA